MSNRIERRLGSRDSATDHGILAARVRPGRDALVIDVCAGGALIETAHRLLPGSLVELQLTLAERRVAMRGCVLRCAVARVRPTGVWYRGAIGFERGPGWLLDRSRAGYSIPSCEASDTACVPASGADHSHVANR